MQISLDSLALACNPPLAWCQLPSPSASISLGIHDLQTLFQRLPTRRLASSLHQSTQQPIIMLFSATVSLALLVPAYAAPHFPLYRRLDASVLHQNGLDAQAQK